MRQRALALFILICPAAALAESSRLITAEEWARPRSAEAVIAMPAVAGAVRTYLRRTNHHIVIMHPESEEGILWAEELRTWLVTLGIASQDLSIEAQSTHPDAVVITAEPKRP